MPTKLKSRDGCWLARVMINGRQVDSKVFPAGRLKGPEWTAAKNWEVQRKKELMAAQAETQAQAQPQEQARTLSGFGCSWPGVRGISPMRSAPCPERPAARKKRS